MELLEYCEQVRAIARPIADAERCTAAGWPRRARASIMSLSHFIHIRIGG